MRDAYDERAEDLIEGSNEPLDPWSAARRRSLSSSSEPDPISAGASSSLGSGIRIDDAEDPSAAGFDDDDILPELASFNREQPRLQGRVGALIAAAVVALVLIAVLASRLGSSDDVRSSDLAEESESELAADVPITPGSTLPTRDWTEGTAPATVAELPSVSLPTPSTNLPVIPPLASLESPSISVSTSTPITTGAIDIAALQRSNLEAQADDDDLTASIEARIQARADALAAEIQRASLNEPTMPSVTQAPASGQADYRNPVVSTAGLWKPQPGLSWQIDFSPHPNLDRNVDAYVLDLDRVNANMVSQLHGRGIRVICYFSAGTIEDFRSDRSTFPATIVGNTVAAWPSERWIDVTRATVVGPLMRARMDRADSFGCDGVDFDNVDGFMHPTGFDITRAEQLRYNIWLAAEAHSRGMSAGLKNDLLQVPELVGHYEWLISESCINYNECGRTAPFIQANKPVLGIDYSGDRSAMCAAAATYRIDFIAKSRILGPEHSAC